MAMLGPGGQEACGRNELARLFVIIGGLIVLALTAALVAPYFIDWTSYRADFEREASLILGRQVKVEGSARARLLPFPSVTFTDVTVAGSQPGQPAMTVDEFSMDAELAPFLRGEILIFDMRLVHPSATVAIDDDGRIDLSMHLANAVDPGQVRLEHVSISDGRIALHHRSSGTTHVVSDIEAVVSARSLAGPWRIDGRLKLDGVAMPVSISTGTAESGRGMRVRFSAKPDAYPFDLDADGRASVDENGTARYSGTFNLRSRPAEAGGEAGQTDADGQISANRIEGMFTLTNERLSIDEFRLETGPVDDPYTAEGHAFVALSDDPRFSVMADGAQINFDARKTEDGGIASLPPEKRFAALRLFLVNLPQPGIPGTIRARLPAIVAGDTTIRDIALVAEPAGDGWSIGSLSAILPGRTRFEAKGHLKAGDALAFSGHMLLAVKQPSGFAAWLARDVDEAIRRLPAAGFSADVDLSAGRQAFRDLELILGDARFTGDAERLSPDNARPSLSLALHGGKLDLDGIQAFSSLFVSDAGMLRLADHDVDFDVSAGPVTARGLTAQSVDAALRLQGGDIEVDRLHVEDLAGANVSATGSITGLADDPAGKLDATVMAGDLEPLVLALSQHFPALPVVKALAWRAHFYPGLLNDAEVDLVASTAANGDGTSGIAISANGQAGGTAFSFGASANGTVGAPEQATFSANLTARNDEAAALYALYGIPSIPLGLAGSARTELTLKGTLEDGAKTAVTFSGDGLKASFDGRTRFGGDSHGLSGTASITSDDLDPWLAAAGMALPGFGFGLPARLGANLDFDGQRFAFANVSGTVAENSVTGDLTARIEDGKPAISGDLELGSFDLALPAAMIVGDSVLQLGGSNWPVAPFDEGISAPFTADVKLAADTLLVGSARIGTDASMQFGLDDKSIRIADLSASLDGGRLSGLADFKNNSGSGLLSAQLRLEKADLARLSPKKGLKGTADLTASVTANGKSVEAMVSALSGSGTASASQMTIAGVNPEAIDELIGKADAIGYEVDAADTAAFAPSIVGTGTFVAGSAELAYSVAGGVVRVPPLQLADGKTRMSVDTRIDLAARSADIKASVAYDPGMEAVMGSEPVVRFSLNGPLASLKTSIDTQPLAQYLTQRALEREQARVEHMQAVLLEKQRLRRERAYYAELEGERKRAEEERRRFEREGERLREEAAEEARKAEEARRQAAEEAARKAAEEARRKAEQEQQFDLEAQGEKRDDASRSVGPNDTGSIIERAPLPPPVPAPAPADENTSGRTGPSLDFDNLPGVGGAMDFDAVR